MHVELKIAKINSVPVGYFSQTEISLILVITLTHPPTTPRESIFEQLLANIGSWNLVWKLYSTKLASHQLVSQKCSG